MLAYNAGMSMEFLKAATGSMKIEEFGEQLLKLQVGFRDQPSDKYSPTVAELLVFGCVGARQQIPMNVLDAIAAPNTESHYLETIRTMTEMWNGYDFYQRDRLYGIVIQNFSAAIAMHDAIANGVDGDLRLGRMKSVFDAYRDEIAKIIAP